MERYTTIRRIGKGNMGLCNLVRDKESGKYYVIKQVNIAKLTNKKERQQSLNEAKVLSALRHPNIINYVDSFIVRQTDHLFIVMEYADGGDIWERIKHQRGQPFSQNDILDMFIQITLALQYIHRKKILHRDVKTQNIFLTEGGVCKLGDFGISKTLSGTLDQANTFLGTPYYLSPELIMECPYDHMSDIWALGVVLYELITLHHPFNARDMKTLMQRILRVQYEPIPHYSKCSKEIKELIPKLLVKDPMRRMKLKDVLNLPAVITRIREWLQGNSSLPSSYIASLVDNRLLPPGVLPSSSIRKPPNSEEAEKGRQLPQINGYVMNEVRSNVNSDFVNGNIRGHASNSNVGEDRGNVGHKVSNFPPFAHYRELGGHNPQNLGGRGEMRDQYQYHFPSHHQKEKQQPRTHPEIDYTSNKLQPKPHGMFSPESAEKGRQVPQVNGYVMNEVRSNVNSDFVNGNIRGHASNSNVGEDRGNVGHSNKLQQTPQNILSPESSKSYNDDINNNQYKRRVPQLRVGERVLPSLGPNAPTTPSVVTSVQGQQNNIPSANPGRHLRQLWDINIKEKIGTPRNPTNDNVGRHPPNMNDIRHISHGSPAGGARPLPIRHVIPGQRANCYLPNRVLW